MAVRVENHRIIGEQILDLVPRIYDGQSGVAIAMIEKERARLIAASEGIMLTETIPLTGHGFEVQHHRLDESIRIPVAPLQSHGHPARLRPC